MTISLGALLGASAVRGAAQLGANAINQHNSRKMLDYQNKMNFRNWRAENAYNSPSAQMSRLKAAGLNPNLVYQSQSPAGIAGSIPSASAGSPEVSFDGNPVSDYYSLVQAQNQHDLATSQIAVAAAEEALKRQQAGKTERENSKMDYESPYWQKNAYSEAMRNYLGVEFARKQIDNLTKQTELLSSNISLNDQQIAKLKSDIGVNDEQINLIRANLRKCNTEIEKIYFDAALQRMNFDLTAREKEAYINQIYQEIENLRQTNDINSYLAERRKVHTRNARGENGKFNEFIETILASFYDLSEILPFK